MKKFLQLFFKFIIVFFIVLTFLFAILSIFYKDFILNILDYINNIVEGLGYLNYLVIFIFGFIESFPLIGISVPGQTVLVIISGFLGYENFILSGIIAGLGAVLGNYVGYLLGVKYGESLIEKYGNWIGIGKTDVKYVKIGINKHGWLFIILGKFHNLFRAFVPFIAGSSGMHSFKFTISNILGSFIRAFSMVVIGVFFVENSELVLNNIGKIIFFLLFLFALYVFFFKKEKLKNYIKEKEKEFDGMLK